MEVKKMKRTKLVFIMLIVTLFVLFSCSEDSTGPDNAKPGKPSNPSPEDNETDVSLTTTISWDCVDPEGDSLTYDVYFGTSSNPSIVNSGQSSKNYDPGTLIGETTYYWKINAHDNYSNSTTGDIWEFATAGGTGTVTDIDGNVYQTIQIGNQEWMMENLKVTHYRNGEPIPSGYGNSEWENLSTGAYCIYNFDPSNAETYGNLYNWYAGVDPRGIAPEGWHVPTDEEIMELEMHLGMSQSQANSLEWRGTTEGCKLAGQADLWTNGTLENNPEFGTSGFVFLPSGYRSFNGNFALMGDNGFFWSSTGFNGGWFRKLDYDHTDVYRLDGFSSIKRYGCSVRCVRD